MSSAAANAVANGNGVGGFVEDYGYGSSYSPMNPCTNGGSGNNGNSRTSSPKDSSESEV